MVIRKWVTPLWGETAGLNVTNTFMEAEIRMMPRIAILDGIRTPFCKAGGVLKGVGADDLGAIVIRELMARTEIDPATGEQLIEGNVYFMPPSIADHDLLEPLEKPAPEDTADATQGG